MHSCAAEKLETATGALDCLAGQHWCATCGFGAAQQAFACCSVDSLALSGFQLLQQQQSMVQALRWLHICECFDTVTADAHAL